MNSIALGIYILVNAFLKIIFAAKASRFEPLNKNKSLENLIVAIIGFDFLIQLVMADYIFKWGIFF